MSIVDLAEGAPPELKSLSLTRVASQPALADRKWKRQLLEEAFEAGRLSLLPSSVLMVYPPDGPASQTAMSRLQRSIYLNSGLDRLSLQTNAIREMSSVDIKQAGQMFQSISAPIAAPAEGCGAEFVPDVARYYSTAAATFNIILAKADERERTETIAQLQMIIARNNAPAAASPEIELISSLNLNRSQHTALVLSFSGVLANMASDNRGWSLTIEQVSNGLEKLLLGSTPEERSILLRGWQAYLMNGLSGTQCKETQDPKYAYAAKIRSAIEVFNRSARAANAGLIPISAAEAQSQSIDKTANSDQQPQAEPAAQKRLREEWFKLQAGKSDADKQSPEWQDQYSKYITDIENTEQSDLSPGDDLLWRKAQQMGLAATAAPPGPLRDTTTQRFLGLLASSNPSAERVSEWYESVNAWLDLAHACGFSKSRIDSLLTGSGQPLLVLIGRLKGLSG